VKVGLFATIVVLEVGPAMTFMRWRRQMARGQVPDTARSRAFASLSHAQMALVVVMVFVAAFMARGFGAGGR
jgi:putative membrane protein